MDEEAAIGGGGEGASTNRCRRSAILARATSEDANEVGATSVRAVSAEGGASAEVPQLATNKETTNAGLTRIVMVPPCYFAKSNEPAWRA
jgi:hypothetical protein